MASQVRLRSTAQQKNEAADDSGGDVSSRNGNDKGAESVKKARPGYLSIIIAVVVAGIVLRLVTPRPRLFTNEALSKFNGVDENLPIFLSILGSVFDVTKGKEHYGIGGGYHHFAGRDASRAFVSGNFTGDGLTDSVDGLSALEVKSIGDWRSFYLKSYTYVGNLVGRYYDDRGRPTEELARVEKRIKRGMEVAKQQEADEKRFLTCNSRWSQNEGGEVWCPSGYPRLVQKSQTLPSQGAPEFRCACFQEKHLSRSGLRVYEGCDPLATVCKTS